MSLYDLENARKLKKAGEKLGREGLAKRTLAIAEKIIKDGSYKGAIKGAGQMKAICQACNFDVYWQEKASIGFFEEYDTLLSIADMLEPGDV